jgi:sugar lactone lactonase YvrE
MKSWARYLRYIRSRKPLLVSAGSLASLILCTCCFAQTPPPLEALSPEFDRMVDRNASFEKVTIAFEPGVAMQMPAGKIEHFIEGPLWDPRGFLLFSDIYGDKIYQWTPGSQGEVFRSDAGYPNGLTFDRTGRLLISNQKLRRLDRLEHDGKITVLADQWQGKKFNCPNDVVVRKDGSIYFTDPFWKFPPGTVQELSFQAVWRIAPDGQLSIAAQDFGLPNGIALSPDEKTLYIGDTKRRKLYAFVVAADGSLTDRRLFADLQSSEKGAVDGMKVDERGDIFTTGPGGVWIFNREGKHLGTIRPPAIPANVAWGDSDYRTLYLATPQALYRLKTHVKGFITYKTNPQSAAYPSLRKEP